jgi:MFS family permease
VLLNLYLLRLGFGLEFIGWLIASGQIIWAVVALPAAAIGRRLGLRGTVIVAQVLLALGMGLFLLVEALPRPIWEFWLVGCWAVMWIGAALQSVNSTPYLMQVSTLEQRNHAFTFQGAVLAVMGFAGSLAAGQLPGLFAARLGVSLDLPAAYRLSLALALPLYTAGSLLWIMARPTPPPAQTEAASGVKPWALFLFLGLVAFLATASEGSVRAFFNVYLDDNLRVPIARIGTIFGVGQILPLLAVLVTPYLLNRWGAASTLGLATAGIGLAMLPLAGLAHWAPAAAGFAAMLTMATIGTTARTVFSQEMVPERWRTTTAAISTMGLATGWATTAAAGGYVIGLAGYRGLFLLNAGFAFGAAALMARYVRSRGGRRRLALDSRDELPRGREVREEAPGKR